MYSLHQSMRFIHRWGEFYQTFTVIFTFNCTPRCYPGGGMKRPVVATWGEDSYQNVHKIFLQTFWMEGCLIHTIRSNSTRFKTKHFPRTSLVPSTEHQWHQWSEMSAQSTNILKDNIHPDTVCSPCCHLTTDTQVSAPIPPDYYMHHQ